MTIRRSQPAPGTAGRVRRSATLAVSTLALVAGVAACSGDDAGAPSSVLDQVAPTKADVAAAAGIEFPASTSEFRLVRISGNQIDVTFRLPAGDVDEFASGSKLTLTDGRRTITHASPLWDVAVLGALSGGSSTENGVTRAAEVVPDGEIATVRLTITKS